MTKMAPCPFCGGTRVMLGSIRELTPHIIFVYCKRCQAQGPEIVLREDFLRVTIEERTKGELAARAAWNKRKGQ